MARSGTASARGARRVGIAIAGFAVLTLGVALLIVPIPGTTIVVMPFGLAILAREFQWARRLLDWSASAVRRTWARVRRLFGSAARSASTPARILTIARAVPVRS